MNLPDLRVATPDDIGAITEIYHQWVPSAERNALKGLIRPGEREQCLVVARDRNIIGWGQLYRYSPRGGYRFCAETRVFIRPGLVRKGYGTQIKKALIETARGFAYHHLLARIEARNEAAIAYNVKVGYDVVGVQKEICFRDGQWEDVVVLQYIIR